jgi:hypothetical protein
MAIDRKGEEVLNNASDNKENKSSAEIRLLLTRGLSLVEPETMFDQIEPAGTGAVAYRARKLAACQENRVYKHDRSAAYEEGDG